MELDNFPFFLLVTALLVLVVGKFFSKRCHPPGPRNFPFLGRLPAIVAESRNDSSFRFYTYMTKVGEQFGAVWSQILGTQRYVILQSHDAVIEAAQNGNFNGRPQVPFYYQMRRNMGVGLSEGRLWRDHKRFMLRTFRQFGMNRPLMEQRIAFECERVVEKLTASSGQAISMAPLLIPAVAHIVRRLIFGDDLVCEEESFAQYIEYVHAMNHNDDPTTALPLFYPFLAKDFFFYRIPGCRKTIENIKRLRAMTSRMIQRIQNSYDDKKEPNCYIAAFLQEQRRLEAEGDEDHTFTHDQLVECCIDLQGAGMDTTAIFIQWALYFAARFPELQQRLRTELQAVVSPGELMKFADRMHCPLMRAFVDEVHRFATIAPLGVDRRSSNGCKFRGFDIEPNDIVVINYYALNHDASVWSEPLAFRPERFLSADGKDYVRSDKLFEFGVGRRACLGVGIATVEIVLFVGTILSQFQVELRGSPDAFQSIELGTDGLIRSPGEHKLTFHSLTPSS